MGITIGSPVVTAIVYDYESVASGVVCLQLESLSRAACRSCHAKYVGSQLSLYI